MVIGITGSIASGKTTTTKYLKSLGFKVIDCDEISHNIILKPNAGYYKLIQNFDDILDGDQISREKLRNIVFNNTKQLKKLNDLLHPLIYDEVKSQINEDIVFIDCPLLFETNFINLCDKSIVVSIDEDIQIQRLVNRNNISKEDAENRISLQMSLKEKEELSTFVVYNNKDENYLFNQINIILESLKEK